MTARTNRFLLVALTALVVAYGTPSVAQRLRARRATVEPVQHAVAVLVPVGQSGVHGEIYLDQEDHHLKITGKVAGLKPGEHAFHVHQYGDLTDSEKGLSAGSHYNPLGEPHGRPTDTERHAGDFGNIVADPQGVATIELTDPVATLSGPCSIVGRSLVIHAGPDLFTQPVGNAGPRVAFGVIGIAAPKPSEKAAEKPAK